jgi:hypothetical protein
MLVSSEYNFIKHLRTYGTVRSSFSQENFNHALR